MKGAQFLRGIQPILFGYDIFISYRRGDAQAYAEDLKRQLQALGFVCFLDRDETVGGVELPPALRRALARSHALVVILTPGVLQSDWVKQEVEAFLKRRGRLIPISIDGFMSRAELDRSPLAPLRNLSWLDDTREMLVSGRPDPAIVTEIGKSHQRMRVRTLAKLFAGGSLLLMAGGGIPLVRFTLEERRQAQNAYADIRHTLGELQVLLKYLVFAAQSYEWNPVPKPTASSFEAFRAPEILEALRRLNFAAPTPRPRLVLGFGGLFPPGDRRAAVTVAAGGALKVVTDMDSVWRRDLVLADRAVIDLAKQLSNHPFIKALSTADVMMKRYHKNEDSDRLRYRLLARPGVSSEREYLAFLDIAQGLGARVR